MPGKRTNRRRMNQEDKTKPIPQLPRQIIKNPFKPLTPLSEDQIEDIHQASLTILQDFGMEVMSQKARNLFKKIGAKVNDDSQMVQLPKEAVEELVASAPATFTLTPRNLDNTIYVGGDVVNFSMVSGPPSVHDRINGRRPANMKDFEQFTNLGQYFNALQMFGNQTMPPIDLPANNRHLDTYKYILINSDKFFNSIPIGEGRVMDAANMVAIAKGQSLQEMIKTPAIATNININSPRKLDDTLADAAIAYAELGLPVVISPFTLMGAMTPVTLAAALAQQNAEALLGLVMLQAANKGTPSVYGAFTSNVDLKTGAPAFGTPENSLANLAAGQLARRYNLPFRISPPNASTSADSQATYETMMGLMTCVLGGGNLIYHAAGWLEGGLLASYEKFILDIEMIQHITELLKPIDMSEEAMGLSTINEIAPGGHFFGCQHTMERYRDAFYQPMLSDWQSYENWEINGAKPAEARATDLWQKALEDFTPPSLDPAITEELEAYVARRKEDIASDEPSRPDPV